MARVDRAAVHEIFTPAGEAGTYLRELGTRGEDLYRAMAPRDTGRLFGSIASGVDHDHDGNLQTWWGGSRSAPIPRGRPWREGFPVINSLEADEGFVWNRSPKGRPRTSGTRRTHPALTASLFVLGNEVF